MRAIVGLIGAGTMLAAAPVETPEVFRRAFDVSLLLNEEDSRCRTLVAAPSLAPTLSARVFCLAREGDWPAAALTLNTARALGDVTEGEDALLSRFLDPDLYEGEAMDAPERISPLVFRMREAIGEGLPTAGLPLAFSHADLADTAAWRLRMEAAERLARNGAISEAVLFDLYTRQEPAASGGVWNRAALVQEFEEALAGERPADVAEILPELWSAMEETRLEVPFARAYGSRLLALDLPGDLSGLVLRIALLSSDYETAALAVAPGSEDEQLLEAVARGDVGNIEPGDQLEAAIVEAFSGAEVPETLSRHIEEGRLGEALLRTISVFNQGLTGDTGALRDALATLRAVGLEDIARRAALQVLLLDRSA